MIGKYRKIFGKQRKKSIWIKISNRFSRCVVKPTIERRLCSRERIAPGMMSGSPTCPRLQRSKQKNKNWSCHLLSAPIFITTVHFPKGFHECKLNNLPLQKATTGGFAYCFYMLSRVFKNDTKRFRRSGQWPENAGKFLAVSTSTSLTAAGYSQTHQRQTSATSAGDTLSGLKCQHLPRAKQSQT